MIEKLADGWVFITEWTGEKLLWIFGHGVRMSLAEDEYKVWGRLISSLIALGWYTAVIDADNSAVAASNSEISQTEYTTIHSFDASFNVPKKHVKTLVDINRRLAKANSEEERESLQTQKAVLLKEIARAARNSSKGEKFEWPMALFFVFLGALLPIFFVGGPIIFVGIIVSILYYLWVCIPMFVITSIPSVVLLTLGIGNIELLSIVTIVWYAWLTWPRKNEKPPYMGRWT